jgi:phosphohistidine swiveling domain-containing protein
VVNSIRIGIADASDARWDSNLLIAGDSVQTVLVANNDDVNINPYGTKTVSVLDNDNGLPGSVLTITHVNDVPVTVGSLVTLPSGQVIMLNADGTFTVTGDGNIETKSFTYTVKDQFGNIDTAFVTMTSVPCFVAGTLILTPAGERRVEDLQPGDLVMTHDDGAQPVRWVGQRKVPAQGAFAPIRIKANTFGDHRTLLLSPQHRVLIRDGLAELLFGEAEVLVAAKDLVNDRSIRVQAGGEVDYVHILFDKHQVVFSEGLATESFLPGPQVTAQLERDIVDELAAIFPELNPRTGDGYGPAARRTLRGHEAQVLFAAGRVA